jgi:hypothetical protein
MGEGAPRNRIEQKIDQTPFVDDSNRVRRETVVGESQKKRVFIFFDLQPFDIPRIDQIKIWVSKFFILRYQRPLVRKSCRIPRKSSLARILQIFAQQRFGAG